MAWRRYLVFAWHGRDTAGGFDDLDAALAFARAKGERRQRVDTLTGTVVRRRDREPA